MLRITIEGTELFDEVTETFSTVDDITVDLEHSLISLSKWESKYEKPFLGPQQKTSEEVLGYVDAMVISPDPPEDLLVRLNNQHLTTINEYIDSKQTATTFNEFNKQGGMNEIITAELVYYWMVAFQIPFDCETWHLNRLFTLIRVCNIKNSPDKKMPRHAVAQQYRDLNAERKARLGTSG